MNRIVWQRGLVVMLVLMTTGLSAERFVEISMVEGQQIKPSSFEVLRTLGRGTAAVAAWNTDGDVVAIGGSLGIHLYRNDYQDVEFIEDHPKGVRLLAWSPDGATLASVVDDETITGKEIVIWDLQANKISAILEGHTDRIEALAWSPDGALLASGGRDHTIRVWNTNDWSMRLLLDHDDRVNVLAWNPNAPPNQGQLLSGSDDLTARIWNISTGQAVTRIIMPAEVRAVAWSPDGNYIATGGGYLEIPIWNADSGELLTTLTFTAEIATPIDDLVWDSDSQRIIASGWQTRIWDVTVETPLYTLQKGSANVTDRPNSSQFTVNSGLIYTYDAATGACIGILLAHSEYASSVVWFSEEVVYTSSVNVWNVRQSELVTHVPEIGYEWNPGWSLLASANTGSTIQIVDWNTATATLTGEFVMGNLPVITPIIADLNGHNDMYDVAWSPDGNAIATLQFGDNTIRVSTTIDWQIAAFLDDESMAIAEVMDWTETGNTLAVGGFDQDDYSVIQLWDMNSYTLETILRDETGGIMEIAWQPADGNTLATTSWDGTLQLWNIANQTSVRLQGHTVPILSLDWSPNGVFLAAGSGEKLYIWDTDTQALEAILEGDQGYINDVAWSPDGTMLASAGEDGTIKVWGEALSSDTHSPNEN